MSTNLLVLLMNDWRTSSWEVDYLMMVQLNWNLDDKHEIKIWLITYDVAYGSPIGESPGGLATGVVDAIPRKIWPCQRSEKIVVSNFRQGVTKDEGNRWICSGDACHAGSDKDSPNPWRQWHVSPSWLLARLGWDEIVVLYTLQLKAAALYSSFRLVLFFPLFFG